MKNLSGMFAEAYASWLSSVSQCCAPLSTCFQRPREQNFGDEKADIVVLRDQPSPFPPPLAEPCRDPFRPSTTTSVRSKTPRKSFTSARSSFSVRKRFLSNASSRRPQISAPSNFRHVYSESFRFPEVEPQPRQRPSSFRPLQLSIYMPDNELSPILPHFDYPQRVITPPPPARLRSGSVDSFSLGHERSYSQMSFHLPRRQHAGDSPGSSHGTPPIPAKSRARAYTSPNVERIAERIASAMIEKDKLQEMIDDCVERQSIYFSSRPSTAHSMALTMAGMEPMPSIPALPPAAPSFAERLNPTADSSRPSTSSVRPVPAPLRPKTSETPGSRASTPRSRDGRPLQPPLPLVLRPPLRKKKSFSRVSTWLFPEHERDLSIDSVTNQPRPIRNREAFYQCISPASETRRSTESVATVSTWESEDEDRTVPTTWSPGSSPAAKQDESPLERTATFGGKGKLAGPRRESVGVAV